MRTISLTSLVLLAGCIFKPNTSDMCFQNEIDFADACDIDVESEDEDALRQSCDFNAGQAIAEGCATELKAAYKCEAEFSAGEDCEDITEAVNEGCAFEFGKLAGCFER